MKKRAIESQLILDNIDNYYSQNLQMLNQNIKEQRELQKNFEFDNQNASEKKN